MTDVNKTARATLGAPDPIDGQDPDTLELLQVAAKLVTPDRRTYVQTLLMCAGSMAHRPEGVPQTEAVQEWLHKALHSVYMTGRMSGCAGLLGVEMGELTRALSKIGSKTGAELEQFMQDRGLLGGKPKPGEPQHTGGEDCPACKAMIDNLPGADTATNEAAVATDTQPEVQTAPTQPPAEDQPVDAKLSEDEAATIILERIIASHPNAVIATEGIPDSVVAKLREKHPSVKFIDGNGGLAGLFKGLSPTRH